MKIKRNKESKDDLDLGRKESESQRKPVVGGLGIRRRLDEESPAVGCERKIKHEVPIIEEKHEDLASKKAESSKHEKDKVEILEASTKDGAHRQPINNIIAGVKVAPNQQAASMSQSSAKNDNQQKFSNVSGSKPSSISGSPSSKPATNTPETKPYVKPSNNK